MPHLEAPPERPFPFVYFITIINDSKQVIVIRGRKWILKNDKGETTVVEGSGVVGETPVLQPGESFSYNSYHVIESNSEVSGAFFGTNLEGKGVRVSIPVFQLKVPEGT